MQHFKKMGCLPEDANDWEFSQEGWEAAATAVYDMEVLGIVPDRSLTAVAEPTSR